MSLPKQLMFELRSPDKLWFEGAIQALHVSTETGALELRPGHASLVGSIDFSTLEIQTGDRTEEYFVRYGIVAVDENGTMVRLLAQDIQPRESVDQKSIEEYLAYITERLTHAGELSSYQVKYLGEQQDILKKSIVVIKTLK